MRIAGRWTRLVTALFLAVVLAACGGSGGDLSEGSTGSDDAGGEGGGGGDLQPVKVAETVGTPSAFLTYGIQQGFFEEEGLDVQLDPSQGGATVIPAVLNGDIDIAGSNVVSVMIAMAEGLPIRMVTAGSATADNTEEDFSGILVPADSPIKGPEGLAGKRIAVNTLRNINEIVLFTALDKRNIDRSGVELVEMGFPDMVPAVERGDVDAAILIEPFYTLGLDQGLRSVLRPYTDMRPGLQIGTLVANQETVEQDPEMIEAFQNGVQATADSIDSDPDAFREALPEIGEFDPKLAQEINLIDWRGQSDLPSLELIKEGMLKYGLIQEDFELTDELVLR